MDHTQQDLLAFFSQQPQALPLCEAFLQKLQAQHPETHTRVQKTQITFSNRHIFACLSFARVRKKALLPDPCLVLTLGLPAPLASPRAEIKTESYPGRWTHHILLSTPDDLDPELMGWVAEAYAFAQEK